MISESTAEEATLQWFGDLGFALRYSPEIAPGDLYAVRTGFRETVLAKLLRDALTALSPRIPVRTLDGALGYQEGVKQEF